MATGVILIQRVRKYFCKILQILHMHIISETNLDANDLTLGYLSDCTSVYDVANVQMSLRTHVGGCLQNVRLMPSHCDLDTTYGDRYVGQHWLRLWLVT